MIEEQTNESESVFFAKFYKQHNFLLYIINNPYLKKNPRLRNRLYNIFNQVFIEIFSVHVYFVYM